MDFPDMRPWFYVLFLVASVLSFLPQLYHTIHRRNSTGISTRYVLFNIISTTEQFALAFFFVINDFEDSDFFVHSPRNAGDWINLVQMGVVAGFWLILFVTCLSLPSERRDCSTPFAIAVYVAVLLISVVPVFADAINPADKEARRWILSLYFGFHSLYLSWVFTLFNVLAIYYQWKEIRKRPQNTSLSVEGLVAQAIVFMILAISWIWRVRFPYESAGYSSWRILPAWYELIGWAAVDTGIFALGQACLLWEVKRQPALDDGALQGETDPLLHS